MDDYVRVTEEIACMGGVFSAAGIHEYKKAQDKTFNTLQGNVIELGMSQDDLMNIRERIERTKSQTAYHISGMGVGIGLHSVSTLHGRF